MNSTKPRDLPLFIDWVTSTPEDKSEHKSLCNIITKICLEIFKASLVVLEVLGFMVANIASFGTVNCFPGVLEEEAVLWDYIFEEKTVTIIPPKPAPTIPKQPSKSSSSTASTLTETSSSETSSFDLDDPVNLTEPSSSEDEKSENSSRPLKKPVTWKRTLANKNQSDKKLTISKLRTSSISHNNSDNKPNNLQEQKQSSINDIQDSSPIFTSSDLGENLLQNPTTDTSPLIPNVDLTKSPSATETATKVDTTLNPVSPKILEETPDSKKSISPLPNFAIKSFNSLSPQEITNRIQTIKTCRTHGGTEDKKVLKDLNDLFLRDVKDAQQKALELHLEFLKNCTNSNDSDEEAPPIFTKDDAKTCSSIFQFKEAVKLAKKQFPGLTTLAFTPNQKLEIAKLIQIIMCGDVAQTSTTRTACCFQFRELQKKTSPEINAFEEQPKNNYLLDILMEKNEKVTPAHAFINTFDGLCKENLNLARLINGIAKDAVTSFKFINSQDISKHVAIYRSAPLFVALGEKDGRNPNVFPNVQKILELAVENAIKSFGPTQTEQKNVLTSFLDFIKKWRTNEKLIELSKVLGCSNGELASFMQLLILETIILRTSNSNSFTKNILKNTLKGYTGPSQLKNNTISTTCTFSLDKTDIKSVDKISIGFDNFFAEGVQEPFDKTIVIAEIASKEELKNLHGIGSEQSKKVILMSELAVSWQTPDQILDYLASQIDPSAIDKQPARRFVVLREEMQAVNEKLKQLDASESMLYAIWGWFKGETTGSKKTLSEKVEFINAAINIASNTYNEFLRTAKLSGQPEKEVMSTVVNFAKSLDEAKKTLASLQTQVISENFADIGALSMISNQIDDLLLQMPKNDGQVDSFTNFFATTFTQSNDAKEISWKISRYEAQFKGLKEGFEKNFKNLDKKDKPDLTISEIHFIDDFEVIAPEDGKELVSPKNGVSIALYRQLESIMEKIKASQELGDKSHFTQTHLETLRKGYEKFLSDFRKAAITAQSKNKTEDLRDLETISMILYTEINLGEVMKSTLALFNEIGANALGQNPMEDDPTAGKKAGHEDEKLHPHVQHIHTLQKRIKKVPYSAMAPLPNQLANSLRGQFNRDFDPGLQSNPVHHLHDLTITNNGKEKVVKIIAMGSPTIEDYQSKISLTPEFQAFGKWCKHHDKKYLYVNNQNFKPTGKSWTSPADWLSYIINGEETNRCVQIMNAQTLPDLKDAFFAMTLAKNSTFYKQDGAFANQSNPSTFKENLVDQVFTSDIKIAEKTGCFISVEILGLYKKVTGNDLREKGLQISDMIHKELFGNRVELTKKERKIFIELFYSHVTKEIAVKCDFDYLSRICKDDIDRGAASNAEAFAEDSLIATQGNPSKHEKEKLEEVLLVRAPFVRKRPMIDERLERFAEGYQFRIDNLKGLTNLHHQLFPGTKILPS